MLPASVTRWRPMIDEQLAKGNYPFPAELVMSLMSIESGGSAGAINPKSGASGLLQVMPGTLDWYNRSTRSTIPLEALRGSSVADARAQIYVGCWVLGQFWKQAYRWVRQTQGTVPVDELVRFGDSFYAAGPRRIKTMLGARPRTWDTWTSLYPESPITRHAKLVWDRTKGQGPTWNLDAIDDWVEGSSQLAKTKQLGIVIGLVILAIASYLLAKGSKKNE